MRDKPKERLRGGLIEMLVIAIVCKKNCWLLCCWLFRRPTYSRTKLYVLFYQESIVDASEDSQLRAAIAASLACTTSTKQTESSSDDEDEDFADLEFSESDSDVERSSPEKSASEQSVTAQGKPEIDCDQSADRTQEICKKESKAPQSEHLNSNGSTTKKSGKGSVTKTSKTEKSKVEVSESDYSEAENKVDSSNDRTHEQAGE